jgi:NTE family protein
MTPRSTLATWLAEGPFTLVLSSGFFSFFAHTGMLTTLTDAGAAPTRVAGSSAGALVGGAWAAGLEASAFATILTSLRRADFWDPAPGAGLLAGRAFDAMLRRLLPVTRLEACRVPVAISVFDIRRRTTTVVERGDLPSAIRASCAVPGLFHPVWIDRRPCWDGGILDRPGLAGVPAGRVLLHHIASRSPWRVTGLALPRRADMVTLVIDDLPRSGPFRLDAGRAALTAAAAATRRALTQPIVEGVVRVVAG